MPSLRSLAALLIASGLASPAWSQAREVCFDPGTARMAPSGYIAVRETGADLEPSGGPWPHAVLRGPRGPDATDRDRERINQTLLELLWVGVHVGRVKMEASEASDPECLTLEVVRDGPPYMALLHFWGPYFLSGSAEVAPEWASRMRFIVAGYQPGWTIYRIQGHADTTGSRQTSMEMSRRRAENVALELVRQGVRWDDIVIEAFGETRLARATADGVAEPLNRRVQVDVRGRPGAAPR